MTDDRRAAVLAGERTARWTLLSRTSGAARAVVVAAALGSSWGGNAYQGANVVPNLVLEVLAGSVVVQLVVPPLVRILAAGRDAHELESRLLSWALVLGGSASLLLALLSPYVAHLLTIAAPPQVIDEQRHLVGVLLVLFAPQVFLYVLAVFASALQNAHGRFKLAAGAPAAENLGVVLTMVVVLLLGVRGERDVDLPQHVVLVLGLGTTASVAAHAVLQVVGARRAGAMLRPRWPHSDAQLRALGRRALPAALGSAINAMRLLAPLVVANKVAGGIVALQLALAVYYLPVAIGARPVAIGVLPVLSRLHRADSRDQFVDEVLAAAGRLSAFCVPVVVLMALLSGSTSRTLLPDGHDLLVVALLALAPSVVFEGMLFLGTTAAYALEDSRDLLRAAVVRLGATVPLVVAAWWFDGAAVLLLVCAGLTVGNLVAACWLLARTSLLLPLVRSVLQRSTRRAAAAAGLSAALVAALMAALPEGRLAALLQTVVAGCAGLLVAEVCLLRCGVRPALSLLPARLHDIVRT